MYTPQKLQALALEYCNLRCRSTKRHVSIITRGKEIEAIATNSFEVPERYAHRGYRSTHSEIAAFMKLSCKRDNLMLFNYRFNRDGVICLSKPCKTCMPWVTALFDTCWYSTNDQTYALL